MKKLLLIAALGFTCFSASAQTTETATKNGSLIKLSFGLASPTGDFEDTNIENETAGFAKNGAFISLGYSKGITKNFALGGTIGWRNNPFNIEDFAKESGLDEIPGLSIEAESWRSTYILADAYGLLPVTNDFGFYLKGSAGLAFSRFPSITFEYGGEKDGYSEAKAPSIAYGVAFGTRLDLGRISVGAESGILANKPEFEMETEDGTEKSKFPMHIITSNISIGYNF